MTERFSLRMQTEARMLSDALFWIGVVQRVNESAIRSHKRFAEQAARRASTTKEQFTEWIDAQRANEAWRQSRLTKEELAILAEAKYAPRIEELHLVAIALEHVSVCLRLIRGSLGPDLDRLRRQFQKTWAKQSHLRDALEHEDELLAGKLKGSEKIAEGWVDSVSVGSTRHSYFDSSGLVSIEVLGRVYEVRASIDAVTALRTPLALALQHPPEPPLKLPTP